MKKIGFFIIFVLTNSLPFFHFVIFNIPEKIENKRYPATGFMPAEFLFLKTFGNYSILVSMLSIIIFFIGIISANQNKLQLCAFASVVLPSLFSSLYLYYIMMLSMEYIKR